MTEQSKTIIFIRHGATEANGMQVAGGRTNVPLSNEGFTQAAALVKNFQGVRIGRVASSHLARAHHTALPLARSRGLEVVQTPLVGE